MKKITGILFSALALVAAVSCNKEADQNVPVTGKHTILTARLDSDATKTTLDGVDIVWSAEDAITAFDAAGNCYTSTETTVSEGGSVAKFSVPTEEPVYAIYPAYEEGSEIEMSEGRMTGVIESVQNAVPGSFDNRMNVAVAKITDPDNIKFKNVGGLVAIKIKGTDHEIVSVAVKDAAEVFAMTGEIKAGFDEDGNVVVDDIEAGKSFVELTGEFEVGETYYAVVAPGIYENVSIVFTDADGKTATYTKKTPLEVTRNSNQLIGGFDIPESKWETPERNYVKVTSEDELMNGTYLIVYEMGEFGVAFDGGLETLDAVGNTIDVEIADGKIASTEETDAAAFTISLDEGSILSKSGKYIGVSSFSNGLSVSDASDFVNTFAVDEDGNAVIHILTSGGTMGLRYNYASNQLRFRYYKNDGQQAIALYLLEGSGTPSKASPELSFEAEAYEITFGDSFEAPVLANPHGVAVTYTSSDEAVATVDETGDVEVIGLGTTRISAVFEGDETFKAQTVFYTLTVMAPPTKVADVIEGGAGNYTLDGVTVYAAAAPNFIIGDETGKMLLYKSKLTLEVGDVINVSGPVVVYNDVLEFNNDATVENTGETVEVDHGTPAEVSEATLAVFKEGSHSAMYVQGTGVQSGRNITVGDVTLYLNVASSATDNNAVAFSGYVLAYSSSHSTYTFQAIELEIDETAATLEVSPKSLTWEADAYGSASAKTITVTTNAAASGYDVDYDDPNGDWSVVDEDGLITVYPVEANESEDEEKFLEITITHGDDATLSETVTLVQAESGAATYGWFETDLADIPSGSTVVIADITSKKAMSNDKGASNPPVAVSVSITDGEITGDVADNLKWVITVSNGTYQFGVGSDYLYCTATNNGVRVGSNANNVFEFVVADHNSDEYFLFNVATNRYLGVYNGQDWRCYDNVNNNIKAVVTKFYIWREK